MVEKVDMVVQYYLISVMRWGGSPAVMNRVETGINNVDNW